MQQAKISDPQHKAASDSAFSTARSALAIIRSSLNLQEFPEANLEAEILVRTVLNLDRAQLFAHPEIPLCQTQVGELKLLLNRRLCREPLPYILGYREFYGISYHVNNAVLIPRPETEILVEEAFLWSKERRGPLKIADIGTGSGCIAITLATLLPHNTQIIATDISCTALDVARANANRLKLQGQVQFLQGDLLGPLTDPVDLIVANLPYVRSRAFKTLQNEIRDFEPERSIVGGPDGIELINQLIQSSPALLRPSGAVMLEIDPWQSAPLKKLINSRLPDAAVRIISDLSGDDRVIVIET